MCCHERAIPPTVSTCPASFSAFPFFLSASLDVCQCPGRRCSDLSIDRYYIYIKIYIISIIYYLYWYARLYGPALAGMRACLSCAPRGFLLPSWHLNLWTHRSVASGAVCLSAGRAWS